MSSSLSLLGKKIFNLEGGFNKNSYESNNNSAIEVIGSPIPILNGIYQPTNEQNNGRIVFEKQENSDIYNSSSFHTSNVNKSSAYSSSEEKVQLLWNENSHQWNLVHVILNNNTTSSSNLLGYCSVDSTTPQETSSFWYTKIGDEFKSTPNMSIVAVSNSYKNSDYVTEDPYSKYSKYLEISSSSSGSNVKGNSGNNAVLFGLPRQLVPLYASFICDAISVGLVMPLLPFFAIELGANAFQLSLVASSNYFAQMIGTIVMGQVSDTFGRKVVLLLCLAASSIQYLFVSYSQNLVQLTLGRIISGMFGGLVPVMQSCVADNVSEADRPKYLGRVTASFGLGFVLGPLLSAAVSSSVLDLTIRQKIRLAAVFPIIGWLISFFLLKETNVNVIAAQNQFKNKMSKKSSLLSSSSSSVLQQPFSSSSSSSSSSSVRNSNRSFAWSGKLFTMLNKDKDKASLSPSPSSNNLLSTSSSSSNINVTDNDGSKDDNTLKFCSNLLNQTVNTISNYTSSNNIINKSNIPTISSAAIKSRKIKPEVLLLVLNGFLLMYAFATETVYAMFIRDSFGLGEKALSLLFALNGVMIGLFQVFLIKPLVSYLGKHATLAIGNAVLAIGMIGVALIRNKLMHFSIFAVHVVGYSIADTALVSLVTHYSPAESQGRALALNHAAQACARVISPLVAGLVYEYSKDFRAGDAIGLPVGALPFLLGAVFPALGIAVPSMLYIWSAARKQQLGIKDTGKNKNRVPPTSSPVDYSNSSSNMSTSAAAATDDDNERLLQTTPTSSLSTNFLTPLKKTAEDNA